MKKNNSKKPFFASFLEKQLPDPEKVQGGGTTPGTDVITYPTMDGETTTPVFDNVTTPKQDWIETKKYPSDSDEAGN
ncbi:MAG: microviridin/marinostatin family tricyclic proteinase inhibitor [Chryseobacterium sp.]|jgi:hypothetical protein|uniref:microviridin/marinostatin family tricyclic proteinase inhibitor n=1 Tax=Chryseobacterium sp. TaxID=1871047 RepID=UPI00282997D0|nr:microviridin/marinostatin family tricyclic proteinase inhibitor [Chryseobacterium sp.]MDR2238533.1 microviridin/marinostatin family tricyclic proteinase inhibitor [Chryseobacterium sp.]